LIAFGLIIILLKMGCSILNSKYIISYLFLKV
jgi:hypothetical protein